MSRKQYPRRPELAGILNLNKPPGMTSHDVVAAVRHAARVRRVGHTGTLDPMATGVLLVCLDQATRVAKYLMDTDKLYRAQIRLGQTTDTDDAEGQIIRQRPLPPDLDVLTLQDVLMNLKGQRDQIPPRFAAIKRNGVPLYKLARKGMDPKPSPRRVVIHAIHLLEWHSPTLTIEVHCGPGTYVRALARDLGEQLDCGGHLSNLIRLRSGRFPLERSTELEEALRLLRETPGQNLANILWPIDAALNSMPRMTVDAEAERGLRQGRQVPGPPTASVERRRVYAADGRLVAIARYDERTGLWQPDTVFDIHPSRQRPIVS